MRRLAFLLPVVPYLVGLAAVVVAVVWLRASLRNEGKDSAEASQLVAIIAHADSVSARRDSALFALMDRIATRDAMFADALVSATRQRGTTRTAIADAQAAPGDTAKVQRALRSCVLSLAADSTALDRCRAASVSKDSAIDSLTTQLRDARTQRERERKLAGLRRVGPRLSYVVSGGYRMPLTATDSTHRPGWAVRAGADVRLLWGLTGSADAAWQPTVPKSATAETYLNYRF